MSVNQKFTVIPFASPVQGRILEVLAKGPIDGIDLLVQVNKKSPVSKQGLYKALRELLQTETIIKNKRIFILSKVWLSRVKDFIEHAEQELGISLPFLENSFTGRKIIAFKNTETLDIYWGHLFLTLAEKLKNKPFFFFNHHSWFIYDRPHSEEYLYKVASKRKHRVMVTLGNNTALDKEFKKRFSKENIQITIDEKLNVRKTDYLCVVDDYFITTRYDKKAMGEIDALFQKISSFGDRETKELKKILSKCKKPKIIIIKNKQKADMWKHRLARNFVIKKSEL